MAQYPGAGWTGGPATGTGLQNPLWGNLLSMIPTVGPILGGIANQITSRIGINKQNQYNSPMSQVARLREAGLPMASMTPAGAGNQSTVPGAHLGEGINQGAKNIGLYAATQAQLKQIKLLNEEIRIREKEADLKEAETAQLLAGRGVDAGGTNLTQNLQSEQAYKAAQATGQQISNDIEAGNYENQQFRLDAENKQIQANTEKILKDSNLIDEKIESENINQKIQNVLAKYQTNMSQGQLEKLLKENGLISEHITGARLDNTMKGLENYLKGATIGNEILESNINTRLKQTMSDQAYNEFIKSKGYNDMVNKARGLWDDPTLTASQRGDALGALIYTTIVGNPGGGSNMPPIIMGIGAGGIGGAGRGVKYDPMKDKNNLDKRKFHKK